MEVLANKFCGGICERALEIFWQECARDYAEREDEFHRRILPESEA